MLNNKEHLQIQQQLHNNNIYVSHVRENWNLGGAPLYELQYVRAAPEGVVFQPFWS